MSPWWFAIATEPPPQAAQAVGMARMVHLEMATPLGIAVSDSDSEQVIQELQRSGRLDLDRGTVEQVIKTLLRDGALYQGSGRWVSGRPDPADFVPGDVAAIRSIVGDAIIRGAGAVSLHRRSRGRLQPVSAMDIIGPAEPGSELILTLDPARMLQQPVLASLLVELGTAVPYFIPTVAAAAVLASRPPHLDLQQDLRLPFDKILVLFGADLAFDQTSFSWPTAFPFERLPHFGTLNDMISRGGYLSGMVLLADGDGRLRDDLIWIVAANPDPHEPWPASLDRVRGVLRGWRSHAQLAPLVHNVAAAVAWGSWEQPPPAPELPADPRNRQFRKALKRNAVRVRERQGALLGVHVLDLGRTIAQAQRDRPGLAQDRPSRASPIPHLRSGHFRRVRIGPRDHFRYKTRWIPPVWVQGDPDKAAQRLVVRRIPPPAAWDQSRHGLGPQLPPPAPDPRLPPGPHDSAFGIDLP